MKNPRPKLAVFTGDRYVWRIPLPRELSPAEVNELRHTCEVDDSILKYQGCTITLDGSNIRPRAIVEEHFGAIVTRLRDALWDMEIVTGENPVFLAVNFAPSADADAA